ncbi:hypothetical protein D3C80_1193120 [compost metagenome]
MVWIFLAHKREDHIIGVKIARWLEIFVALELHPLAQMEGVHLTVFADVPAFCQARLQLGGTDFEIHQPVIDRHRAGIYAGPGGVELRVKVFW